MDNSKTEKQLHTDFKYEEKKAKQREKRRLGPNAGTGARGYGIFKKERLFDEPNKPTTSRKLPIKPRANGVKKRITQVSTESQSSGCEENSCNQIQDPDDFIYENQDLYVVPTQTEEATKKQDVLKERIERMREEAKIENTTIENLTKKSSVKTWAKRREDVDSGWDTKRETYLTAFIKHKALSQSEFCSNCKISIVHLAVRCRTCFEHYCPDCDWVFHFRKPFHDRELFEDGSSRPILPTECVLSNGNVIEKAVPVPLYVPADCTECSDKGKIELVSGPTCIAVVNQNGRFDLRHTQFLCSSCGDVRDATPENYIASGYFPGTTSSISCYFSIELIEFWNILKHETPGTSERKFIKTLELISKMRGRYGVINRTHFARASKEYEFLQHKIRQDIVKLTQLMVEENEGDPSSSKNAKILFCTACGKLPLAIHLDGNFKLLRWQLKHQYDASSLFGDNVISADSDVLKHIQKINEKKIPRKEKDSCGGSTYTAGRSDAARKKNIAQTGMLMASCRHGVVLGAANMERGETYRHVHFLHSQLPSKFFCQDVICHYWPFAHDVGLKLTQYSKLTSECSPFLSRWHGKTHSWPCQILWSGHWKKGAAATLGEEQEQVFSTMSRYGSCTKHMSDASRRDHLSAAILYWNERKNDTMDKILAARLLKARKQAPIHRQELQKLLKRKGISEKDLPFILEELKIKAIESNDKLASSNWALSYERGDLEGTYLHIKRIERRIALIAGSSKERIKMRKGLSVAKTKAKLLIAQINEAIKECRDRQKLGVFRENDRNIETWAEITENDFHDGVFPWQTDGIVSRENFDLIDTWMLMMRYDEEVIQVEEEITNYCDVLLLQKRQLEKEIESLKLPAVSMCQEVRGRYFLLLREVANLKEKIAKSVCFFQRLEVDEFSSSSSSDENDESPDCSSAEEEVRDGASEEMEY